MKPLFSVLVLAAMLPSLAFSQSAISITALPGSFGELLTGTVYTITPDGVITPDNVLGAIVPIEWDIIGDVDSHVLITFGLPAFFSSPGSSSVPYVVSGQSAGWAHGPIAPNSPYNPIDPRVPNTITLTGGAATVQLGGVLTVPRGANGPYTAQFILTASYTGL